METLRSGKRARLGDRRERGWDPKSGLTLIIDPSDGRVITTEWNVKPMKNWQLGWFETE
jgi:hypothetical protein